MIQKAQLHEGRSRMPGKIVWRGFRKGRDQKAGESQGQPRTSPEAAFEGWALERVAQALDLRTPAPRERGHLPRYGLVPRVPSSTGEL